MKHRLLTVLLGGLLFACAPVHYTAFTLDSSLQMLETADMVRPDIAEIAGDSHARYIPPMIAAIERRGMKVAFISFAAEFPEDEEFWTYWGYNTGTRILIEHSLSPNGQFATLVHEYGHSVQPDELDGTLEGQVFAEALAVIVCKELGLEIWQSSYGYLQQFQYRHAILERYSTVLDREAQFLLKELR